MFELLVITVFCLMFGKVLKLVFHITWGMAKIVACVLCVLACPALILCLLFASGFVLVVPVLLVVGAYSVLKAFVA